MRTQKEIANDFDSTESLNPFRKFFLVGIGGAGMSALARMLNVRGYSVRGTDAYASTETGRLTSEGIEVFLGHSGDEIQADEALVLTDAIDLASSPEVARAKELGIPIVRRSQALGWLLRDYKVIAVTGTHGKTTTTGLVGAALIAAGFDPLVVVGASIPQFGGPVREGKGEYAVVEACEAYDSFHDLQPHVVVLTNLELDHVDFHGTYENLRSSVVRFVDKIPADGHLIYCSEDRGASEVAELTSAKAISYGASPEWLLQVSNKVGGLTLPKEAFPSGGGLALPGHHNLLNAAGALTVCAILGAELARVEPALRHFSGAERRLQVLQDGEITVIDDYAHHPTEVHASLTALRERYLKGPGRRLIVVFQPHLYSRTAPLIQEFADALSVADEVVLTDIYPAREKPQPGVSSARVAEKVSKPVRYVPSRHLLPRTLAAIAKPGDVIVGMGAGTIGDFAPALVKELARREAVGPKQIVVAYGGESAEREVSLHSGIAVANALQSKGHNVRLVDFTDLLFTKGDLSPFIGVNRPDVVFLAVHGTNAEDGGIQGLLELLHIPYTGSGIQASAIAMDKAMTKRVLQAEGVSVPRGVLLTHPDQTCDIPTPLIVKPNAQGSTVGLTFVSEGGDVAAAIRNGFAYDSSVLVEEWVKGMEISVPVLVDKALAPVEIAPTSGLYDFASKYLPGATQEIIPARLPDHVIAEVQAIALKAHQVLGCKGATRTDMIVVQDGDHYRPVILEVNTLPGMTATSLLPNSAAACDIPFADLCAILVEDALMRHAASV